MVSNYEPGTVAVATVRGQKNVRVMRADRWGWMSAVTVDHFVQHEDSHVTDIRPLVVLDLSGLGPLTFQRLLFTLRSDDWHWVVAQIKEQTKPPKPPEPTGLGAVVEDVKGRRWVRTSLRKPGLWSYTESDAVTNTNSSGLSPYDRIDVVRVLSEGVQP